MEHWHNTLMRSVSHLKKKDFILYVRESIWSEARTLILDFELSITMSLQLGNTLLLSESPSSYMKISSLNLLILGDELHFSFISFDIECHDYMKLLCKFYRNVVVSFTQTFPSCYSRDIVEWEGMEQKFRYKE